MKNGKSLTGASRAVQPDSVASPKANRLATVLCSSASLVLWLTLVTQSWGGIEASQRAFQKRYEFWSGGGAVTWPANSCACPAPAYPADNFYGDRALNSGKAVEVVDHLHDQVAWFCGYFVSTYSGMSNIDGKSAVPYYTTADFNSTFNDANWTTTAITKHT
jgi:hypothetical protein